MKRMTLLAKREDMRIETFRSHWSGRHAQLALSLPGVCKYTQNRVESELLSLPHTGAFHVNGIVELFFTDEDAMKQAWNSDTGSRIIPDDELLFLRGWTLSIVETDGPHDHVGAKVIVPIALRDGISVEAACLTLRDAALGAGATQIASNRVISSHERPRLWSEPVPPELFFVCWFETVDQACAAFSEAGLVHAVRDTAQLASACLCDPLVIR